MDPRSRAVEKVLHGLPVSDRAFARLALDRGFVDVADLSRAADEWRSLSRETSGPSFGQILLRLRLLSVEDFQVLRAQVRDEGAPDEDDRSAELPGAEGDEDEFPVRWGRFELLAEIARGGMGIVYRARDPGLGREVAVKIIRTERVDARNARKRFRLEAEAAGRLAHPNIVKVHEAGIEEGLDYYVMELVRGRPLDEYVEDHPLDPLEACALARDLARALQAAHDADIVHRDLKPQNIIVDGEGIPHLTDFGLAKLAEGDGLTRTGAVIGTPFYMSPEQAGGETDRIDHRTDIFSLGVVLYELTVGRRPFDADSPRALYRSIIDEPTPRPSRESPGLPPALDRVVHRALEKEPDRRYGSMEAFADDLDRVARGERPATRGTSSVRRAAERVIEKRRSIAVIAVPAALLGFVLYQLLGTASPPDGTVVAERVRSEARARGRWLEGGSPEGREAGALAVAPLVLARLRAARLLAGRDGPGGRDPSEGLDPARRVALLELADAFEAAGWPGRAAGCLRILDEERSGETRADLASRMARLHLDDGRPDRALEVLESSGGRNELLHAGVLIEAGRAADAEEILDRRIGRDQDAEAYLLRAKARLAREAAEPALEDLDRAAFDPAVRARAAVVRAEALEQLGRPEAEILAHLASARERIEDPRLDLERAKRLLRLALSAAARARTGLAVEHPRVPEGAYVLHAKAELALGRPGAAAEAVRQEVRRRPSGEALGRLGVLLGVLGRRDEAHRVLRRALVRGDPRAAIAGVDLALAETPPDLEGAARWIDLAGRSIRSSAFARHREPVLRARVAARAGRRAEALRRLEALEEGALDADPRALGMRGRLRLPSDREAGETDLRRARELLATRENPGWLPQRPGRDLLRAARTDGLGEDGAANLASRAVRHLEVVVRLSPGWAGAWTRLGRARLLAGEGEAGRRAIERAVRLDPTDPVPRVVLARHLLAKRGSPERAAEHLELALVSGAGPEARLLLARALARGGRSADALAEARAALSGLEDLRSEDPGRFRSHLEEVRDLALAAGDEATAARIDERVEAVEADRARARELFEVAAEHYRQRRFDEVREVGEMALELDPGVPGVHGRMGKAYMREWEVQPGLYHMARELLRSPDFVREAVIVLDELARTELADMSVLSAVLDRRAVEHPDEPAVTLIQLLLVHQRGWARGLEPVHVHELLVGSRELLDEVPGSAMAWFYRASALAFLGLAEEAREALGVGRRLADVAPPDPVESGGHGYGSEVWEAIVELTLGTDASRDRAEEALERAVARGLPPDEDFWVLGVWDALADRPVVIRARGER